MADLINTEHRLLAHGEEIWAADEVLKDGKWHMVGEFWAGEMYEADRMPPVRRWKAWEEAGAVESQEGEGRRPPEPSSAEGPTP